MSLYEQWKNTVQASVESAESQQAFWDDFCNQEQTIYEEILGKKEAHLEGVVTDLAGRFGVEPVYFMGFLNGIIDSIRESNVLESLEESSPVSLDIDFEKLYYNMLSVPAPWLFELEQWNDILSMEQRKAITKEYNRSKTVVITNKIGRNDACPCGSGLKYKKCCAKIS